MSKEILLPRTTAEGKPRISHSQIELFNELESYNMETEGVLEYMVKYFLGYSFPDKGYGTFGKEVEAYIAHREKSECFTAKEKEKLNEVTPLGVVGSQFEIDYGEFVLYGIIDDRSEDWTRLRDYKTASKSSKEKYETEEYKQLDIYALKSYEITGEIPELEVCVIERKGNAKFKGRQELKVGENIWYIPRKTNEERLDEVRKGIFKTVCEISDYYKLFLTLNK